MSKFEVVDYPRVLPQKCLGCGGTGRSRYYLDLGLSVDRYGRLYLCGLCVAEIADVTGFVQKINYEVKKAEAETWEEKYQELHARWKELKDAMDALRNAGINAGVFDSSSVSSGEELPESDRESGRDDSELVEQNSGTGFGIL